MVQELRWIMLDKLEVMQALEAHNRMAQSMPKGRIAAWDYIDQTSIKVSIEKASAQIEDVFLEREHLLQPLIRFCRENNIMLPLDGRKSVIIGTSNISLCISLDIDAAFIDKSFPVRKPQFTFTYVT